MANTPKKEGYFGIDNEVVEKLARFPLSGTEYRVILAVLRKTLGWQKKEDRISTSQLAKMTELSRRSARRSLASVVNRNIILKNFGRDEIAPGSINFLRFNKYFETWRAKDEIAPRGRKCAQKYGRKCATQKKRKTSSKIIIKKEYFDLVDLLIDRIRLNDPKAKVADTEGQREEWANDFKLLIERDGRSIEEVCEVLIWCQENPFWRSNILSAGKLRKQFTQLKLKKEAMHKPGKPDPAELTRKEMKQ